MWISYIAAVLAAVANAASNVLNRKAAREEPDRVQFRLRLILDLLHRRTWLAAVAVMLVSFLLGAVALGTGELATVQTIIILELPMTLIGGPWVLGGHLGKREWGAVAAMTAGVIGFLACLDPSGGTKTLPVPALIIGSAASGGVVLAAFLAARAARNPARRAALLGAACGVAYGLASAYTKGMTQQFSSGGVTAVLASWQLYAAGVAGLLATWLLENAYQAGRLAAAQPGITLLDPVTATLWGVLAFGEQVRSGPVLALAVLPVLLLAGGVVLLSRSPVLQSAAGADESGGGRGRQDRETARETREATGT
ncbi:MAG: DMT family transporter [Actinobacteria bacterium]|nr:DMT family transporter [Actinomycetota bacterium]